MKTSLGHFFSQQIILTEEKEVEMNLAKQIFVLFINKFRFLKRWIRRSTKFRLNFHLKELVLVENRIKCLKEIFKMHDFINIYKLCVLLAFTLKLNISLLTAVVEIQSKSVQ